MDDGLSDFDLWNDDDGVFAKLELTSALLLTADLVFARLNGLLVKLILLLVMPFWFRFAPEFWLIVFFFPTSGELTLDKEAAV